MAELKRVEIDGKMATVAYMAPDFDGEVVEPEAATCAIIHFDDGTCMHTVVKRDDESD